MRIVIIHQDGQYYYEYGERLYVLNEETFDSFRSKLSMPLNISFKNCSMTFITNLAQRLFTESIDLGIKCVNRIDINIGDYEVEITNSKQKSL